MKKIARYFALILLVGTLLGSTGCFYREYHDRHKNRDGHNNYDRRDSRDNHDYRGDRDDRR